MCIRDSSRTRQQSNGIAQDGERVLAAQDMQADVGAAYSVVDHAVRHGIHHEMCIRDSDLLCANLQPRCEVLEDIPPQLDFFDAVLPIDAEMYRNKQQKTTVCKYLNQID